MLFGEGDGDGVDLGRSERSWDSRPGMVVKGGRVWILD